ncbi:MAG: hypothetical protein ACFFDN_34210, partial [Candidatus Hodarchaeota archaeon]
MIFADLRGVSYFTLLFQNASLILYIMSYFIVKFEKNLKNWIEFILFVIFQGLLAINLSYIFSISGILNLFLINLVILIEICLSFITLNYISILLGKQKYPDFLPKMHSLMVLVLYFEISFMVYGLLSEFIGIFQNLLVSFSILSALTLLDIYGIKKIKRKYSTLVHTISYFTISLILFLFLHNLVSNYPFLLSLEILIFITMQFYTNYSLFTSLKDFNPDKKDSLKEIQVKTRHLLGVGFYITLSFFIFQVLYLQRLPLQLILLILSIVLHVLMIIDSAILKFLGKASGYIKVISWLFIMTFTSTYLVWVFVTNFITFIFTVIPIIITILILELAYLFKLLEVWQIIASNKEKIRSYLIVITYFNFITWPLYFASLNPFIVLNLVLASFIVMILITFVDDNLEVLKEKFRRSLRSYSFLIIGGLISIDIFFLLNFIPDFNLFLNLSISSLVFVLFLGIKIKPFKEHSAIAAIFWLVIFLLLSVIVYFVSLSLIAGLVFLIITCMVYPFVFLLEELKELFIKFVDIISKFFRSLKIIIKKMFIKIFSFLKMYFKYIWIPFSMMVSV